VCAELAARRYGVFSRREVLSAGMPRETARRRVANGEWVRCYPGVYRAAAVPRSWAQELVAACMWAGRGSAASYRSAAALLRLDGFAPGVVEITTGGRIRSRPGRVLVHHSSSLSEADVVAVDAIPTIRAARTLIDLAAVAPIERVELALEAALRRELVTVSELTERLELTGRQGRRGAGRMARLLERRGDKASPSESLLETRLIQLLRRAGLPDPERQFVLREHGTVIARVDFAYPDWALAIEVDGYRWHSGYAAWQRELSRQNALVLRGWKVLRFTWDDVLRRRGHVVAEIRRFQGRARDPQPARAIP
jgi:very-short-patch-repair endonuclease